MASRENALVVFARTLRQGRVKTRLEGVLTAAEACELHAALVEDVVDRAWRAAAGLATVSLAWSGTPEPGTEGALSLPRGLGVDVQPEGDLGERMALTVQGKLKGGARAVVIMGSDAPTLPEDHIVSAFGSLREADVVIGPARDGGYYLIGMTRLHLDLFRGIRWGSPEVLPVTLRKIRKAGLRCTKLGEWSDVDTPDEVRRLWKEILRLKDTMPGRVPRRTYAVLARLAPGRLDA